MVVNMWYELEISIPNIKRFYKSEEKNKIKVGKDVDIVRILFTNQNDNLPLIKGDELLREALMT